MALENALLNVPVLREMLAIQQFDENERARRVLNSSRIVDMATKLAEMQSLPAINELRRAQADKAMFEIKQAREAAGVMQDASRHLRPRDVPLQGPVQEGQPPLEGTAPMAAGPEQFDAFIQQIIASGNPQAIKEAQQISAMDKSNYVAIPAGGLYNTKSRQVIGGGPSHPLAKLIQLHSTATAEGNTAEAQLYNEMIDKMVNPSPGTGIMGQARRMGALITKSQRGDPLTDEERLELEVLVANSQRPQYHQDPTTGAWRLMPPMQIPNLVSQAQRVLGVTPGVASPAAPPAATGVPGAPPSAPAGAPSAPQPTWPGAAPGLPPMPQGAKELDKSEREWLEKRSKLVDTLESLVTNYDPKYFFNSKFLRVVPMAEDATMYLSRRGIFNPATASWWRPLLELTSEKRHEIFGATLTPGEHAAFEKLRNAMYEDPALAVAELKQLLQYHRSSLDRKVGELTRHSLPAAVYEAARFTPEGQRTPSPLVYGDAAIEAERAKSTARPSGRRQRATD